MEIRRVQGAHSGREGVRTLVVGDEKGADLRRGVTWGCQTNQTRSMPRWGPFIAHNGRREVQRVGYRVTFVKKKQ